MMMMMRSCTLCIAILLGSTACAQKMRFNPSTAVPAADAWAKVTRDTNNNARIRIDVRHLANPQRLDPPREVYVVWAETPDARTLNLGRLAVDKNRRGTLESTTSLREFRLLISAEHLADAVASSPSRQTYMATDFFRVN